MALTGRAFLALFNDFDPARDDEYNAWHSREHVPQRLAVPGIARARRYVGRAEPRFTYFTLYEMASAATLQSRPYLDLLANPTPWSAAMRPSFRQFLRIPCRTLASAGEGVAGALAVLVCEASAATAAAPPAWQGLCDSIAALDGLVGAHAGEQDASAPGPAVAAAQALAAQPTFVLLVEAQEARWLARQRSTITALMAQSLPDCRIAASHEYQLMHLLTEGRAPA
jgi:hypothetical protein